MIINWYGEGCFRIQSGGLDVLIDPFESGIGLTPPRFQASVTIKTLNEATFDDSNKGEKDQNLLIKGAGEYDLGGAEIKGFQITEESTDKFIKSVYVLNLEGIKIGLLGHVSQAPNADVEDALSNADILIVPVGGKPFLETEAAVKLIKKLEPKIIIPTFFKVDGLKRETKNSKEFVKGVGFESTIEEKLVIKKKDLSGAKTKVVVLKI